MYCKDYRSSSYVVLPRVLLESDTSTYAIYNVPVIIA